MLTKKIPVSEIRKGMFITNLDRPWLETPFLYQGFLVSDENEIKTLNQLCQHVYIQLNPPTKKSTGKNHRPTAFKPLHAKSLDELLPQRQQGRHKDKVSIQQELPNAQKIQADMLRVTKQIFSSESLKNGIDVAPLKQSVEPMINSVIRNPDALIWLSRLKSRDDYSYCHAMRSSVWAISLGRQLGLPKGDLRLLAVGSLLCDIGKARIPQEILNKPGELTDKEFEVIKHHVSYSIAMLEKSRGVSEPIFEIVANHHERHAGHGYPRRLKGDQIPIFARIAAIADCYDAISNQRVHAAANSPCQAIKRLYEWRNYDFQAELVEEFIQAVGIYPVGSLVSLNTGQVGVVIAEGRQQRLRPTVMILLDHNKEPTHEATVIDLLTTTRTFEDGPLVIEESLQPNSYGIDPEELYL